MSVRASAILWGLASVAGIAGCTKDDIGKTCHPASVPELPPNPVGGENPVIEVVSLERSSECETFQCLTEGGYASFCTRDCTVDMSSGNACTTSADCKAPKHCFEGQCRDDDCPSGFTCQHVQDVGPLANRLFCVYKDHCASNRDCEALGDMKCEKMGCFDSTLLLQPPDPNAAHTLTCESRASMTNCQCPDGTQNCTGADLACFNPDATKWPDGSVDVRDVCQRQNP